MFTFISYWRTAAVVLCDLSSTVYYIGQIVESAIGKAAPWFILAVLCFSFAMSTVYIESSVRFVRGGVYRVVKEAMGGYLAKISVSALMFDYILTGPISSVSAGQYIISLVFDTLKFSGVQLDAETEKTWKKIVPVVIAVLITVYFFWQNLKGIPESSDKASKIMKATAVMAVVMLVWCTVTLIIKGPVNPVPNAKPDLHKKTEVDEKGRVVPKINPLTGEQEDPLGFIAKAPAIAEPLRDPPGWLSLIGAIGIIIAFGHSILAMSGLETLAQVYREVEAPKVPNFKKAALIVFVFSFLLTGSMNFFCMILIPDELRLGQYSENWMGGLAMQMVGPLVVQLLLNGFVVVVGFLILSGAVNTSIIGSNGVLSRVAEDGVLPDWFLKPHKKYGTNSRILYLITGLQLLTIIASGGDMILLGEAYAFGVVWSFVFKTSAMVVLRFKDRTPREFKVPLNLRIGNTEIPIGLIIIFLIMFTSALANLATKEVATISGVSFSLVFLVLFIGTEKYYERKRRGTKHEHIDQFNRELTQEITPKSLNLTLPYRKLVAIRSPQNLFMLEKTLADMDPDTTEAVVMTAKMLPPGDQQTTDLHLDAYDEKLMTAVIKKAEGVGKQAIPVIIPTNNPLHAVMRTAYDIGAQEIVIGASNKFTAEEQLDQISLYWVQVNTQEAEPRGLTVRILGRDRDVTYDLFGGNRIPKISERRARSVDELRASGVGIDRTIFLHDGTQASSDLFMSALTLLDPAVVLDIVHVPGLEEEGKDLVEKDVALLERLKRTSRVIDVKENIAEQITKLVRDEKYDLIIMQPDAARLAEETPWVKEIINHAPCQVCLIVSPQIPRDVEE